MANEFSKKDKRDIRQQVLMVVMESYRRWDEDSEFRAKHGLSRPEEPSLCVTLVADLTPGWVFCGEERAVAAKETRLALEFWARKGVLTRCEGLGVKYSKKWGTRNGAKNYYPTDFKVDWFFDGIEKARAKSGSQGVDWFWMTLGC